MDKLIQEHFNSISEMLSVICSRPNNHIMKERHSSVNGEKLFTRTKNWDEAMNLYKYGYTEVLEEIKKGTTAVGGNRAHVERNKIVNDVIGYAPHVPNAILGLPNSMIGMKKIPQKVKTVSIIYEATANCCEDSETFVKAGIALLSAINILELSGIRVNLRLCYFFGQETDEYTYATVKLKDYREHLDIQKLCFPIVHPSMFRRFGFKWLETCEGLTRNWNYGYGRHIEEMPKIIKKEIRENEYFISMLSVKEENFDPRKIIEQIKK